MRIKGVNIYDFPEWMTRIREEMEADMRMELGGKSERYSMIWAEIEKIMQTYPKLEPVIERGEIIGPVELTADEAAALSRFLKLDAEQTEIEETQAYLCGVRHIFQILQFIGII